jgi:hypothetical protein
VIHETASNNVSRITMQNVRFSDVLVTITKLILASPEALAVPFFGTDGDRKPLMVVGAFKRVQSGFRRVSFDGHDLSLHMCTPAAGN